MTRDGISEVRLGNIDGVHIWKMPVFEDERGRLFKAYVGSESGSFPILFETYEHFFTESRINVFRGMHFQQPPHAARKIISLVRGKAEIFLLDARADSSTYGCVQRQIYDQSNLVSIYIPTGVALGYLILTEGTTISYRMDVAFCGNCDAGIDPEVVAPFLEIPLSQTIRSVRDTQLQTFGEVLNSSPCSV